MCCNVVAKGQWVVATGLMRLEDGGGGMKGWAYKEKVSLCTLPAK